MLVNGDLGKDINKDPVRLVVSERKLLVAEALSPNTSMEEAEKEKPLLIQIKKNTNPTAIPLDLTKYADTRMEEIMRDICPTEIEANKQIRMIYQGKQLKEDDFIKDIKFKPETVMHFFISDPVQKDVNITTISAELYEPERRGFDKFRPLDLMEEEIIMFRGKFHAKFILLAEKNMINENELYRQEEDWLKCNEEHLIDADTIRQTMRNYEEEDEGGLGTVFSFIMGIIMGVLFNIFLLAFLIFGKMRSARFIKGAYLGIVLFFGFLFFVRAIDIV